MNFSLPHILIGAILSAGLTAAVGVQAQTKAPFLGPNTNAEGDFALPTPKQAAMQKAAEGSSGDKACRKYLEGDEDNPPLSLGFNFVGTKDEIAIAIGAKETRTKVGKRGFIDSRYVAFREATLEAKKQMVKTLEQQIMSETTSSLTPKKEQLTDRKSLEKQAANLQRQAAKKGEAEKSNYNAEKTVEKGMRWLNAQMDQDLKELGHDPQAEEKARKATNKAEKQKLLAQARKAEKAAKKIIQSDKFKEVIRATARQRMKGIYTVSTNETVTPEHATICVVAAYSPRSEMLADAMASRDFSEVPKFDAGGDRIRDQLLDRTVKASLIDAGRPENEAKYRGQIALASAWGIDIMVDENGHVNLVAYGQAGVSHPPNRIRRAKASGAAQLKAENLIRLFINSAFALDEAAKTAENMDELADETTKVALSSDYEAKLEEKAAFMPINGIAPVHNCTFIHPATSQEIRGSVVRWNASMAAVAIASKQRQERQVKDTGGKRYKKKAKPKTSSATGNRAPLRRGRISTTKKSKRF
ncbi:MAG: hypothetical protein VYA17_10270 [Pseudomonadota bacterium]|nr:hypothetical protein [Pseudomonadota bacterium]